MVGSGLGYLLRPASAPADENAHIRDLEAQYMSLYSVETLLDMDSAAPVLQRGLERAAQDIGMKLTMSQLILRGAELKMVRMLRYETTSIAQIARLNADYGPMALCISPVDEKATASLRRAAAQHEPGVVAGCGLSVCPDWPQSAVSPAGKRGAATAPHLRMTAHRSS